MGRRRGGALRQLREMGEQGDLRQWTSRGQVQSVGLSGPALPGSCRARTTAALVPKAGRWEDSAPDQVRGEVLQRQVARACAVGDADAVLPGRVRGGAAALVRELHAERVGDERGQAPGQEW